MLAASEALVDRRGSGPSRADTALALADVLGIDRVRLLLEHERPLTAAERATFRARLQRMLAGEPLAYVLGRREFYGRTFEVDRRVLIPRPESELLVDEAKARLPAGAEVFEPCTGSGCVAISLALERPDLGILASDVEAGALEVAKANAERLAVAGTRLSFAHGSYWAAAGGRSFDALVANPPYVDPARPELLDDAVRDWEPASALFTPESDPMFAYRALLTGGLDGLRPGAIVLFELGIEQASELAELIERSRGYEAPELVADLAGLDRVLCCRRRSADAATGEAG